MKKLKELWLRLSLENRKRIISFTNTLVVTFLIGLAAQIDAGFPQSWVAFGAVMTAVLRTSVREALNALVARLK